MTKSIDINSLLKATGNEYATVVGKKGVYTDAQFPPYDTGSMTLNCLLGGQTDSGMPSNKITALAGEQGVGKTYFALSIAKEFLDMHPEGIFVYADTEGATTKEMLAERVGHLDRIIVLPVATVQAISTQLSNLLTWWEKQRKKDPDGKMLVVLDSLGNLSTTKEVTDIEKGNETKDMTRAQLLKGTFRALTLKFALNQVPLLFTNHTYQGMGMFASKTMSGGGGPLFNASQIIFLTKSQIKEGSGMAATKVGNVINMTNFKGRGTKEGAKAKTRLFFDTGLDRYYGLLDIAKDAGIWEVSGGQCIIDGEKRSKDEIENNPEKYFTPEIMIKVNEACARKFMYGQADDETFDEETADDVELS